MEVLLWDIPKARRTDPDTSHEAAERSKHSAATHARIVLSAVKEYPNSTSVELTQITGIERHEVSRRLADLKNSGMVSQGPARLCNIRNAMMVTWYCMDGMTGGQGRPQEVSA